MENLAVLAVLIGIIALVVRVASPKRRPGPDRRVRRDRRVAQRQQQRFETKTSQPAPSRPVVQGKAYVIDGDSLVIQKTQIRLFGVDAPELNHPYGKNAKWALVSLCKGHVIRAEVTQKDAYGRTVARCYLPDGRDLSAEMVQQGLAIDWPKFSGGRYRVMETPDARKKLWLADARHKGRMFVWEKFEAKQRFQVENQQ